jgi:hypothetical protein
MNRRLTRPFVLGGALAALTAFAAPAFADGSHVHQSARLTPNDYPSDQSAVVSTRLAHAEVLANLAKAHTAHEIEIDLHG